MDKMNSARPNTQRITALLHEWRDGKKAAFDEIFPFVYDEMRRRASAYLRSERSGHTLQTTALANEAYIKLIDKAEINYQDRNHFFAIAATAMRRILVDHARTKGRDKRGGKDADLPLDEARAVHSENRPLDLVALDEALVELASFDQRQAKVVELKYFGGMTNEETAEVLGISNVTVRRDWDMARAWLRQVISN